MLYEANLDGLKRCVRNNEKAPNFVLDSYRTHCGTYGCLVGNDSIAKGISDCEMYGTYKDHLKWGNLEYGIESNALDRQGMEQPTFWNFLFGYYRRECVDREACISRLRKFIAYIERKRAIWYEADGRISERARRTEGNWNVCASVLNSIAVSA